MGAPARPRALARRARQISRLVTPARAPITVPNIASVAPVTGDIGEPGGVDAELGFLLERAVAGKATAGKDGLDLPQIVDLVGRGPGRDTGQPAYNHGQREQLPHDRFYPGMAAVGRVATPAVAAQVGI